MAGRPPVVRDRALAALGAGPMTVREIASAICIPIYHARALINQLRQAEKVRAVGTIEEGQTQKVWALVSPFRRADQWTPVIEKEAADAERDRWLAELLDKWARFMRAYWGPQGYPHHSPGMPSRARIQSFEDLENEVDQYMVAACDACIDDLSPMMRTAIYYRHRLTDAWVYREAPQDVMETAYESLLLRLKERIAVP